MGYGYEVANDIKQKAEGSPRGPHATRRAQQPTAAAAAAAWYWHLLRLRCLRLCCVLLSLRAALLVLSFALALHGFGFGFVRLGLLLTAYPCLGASPPASPRYRPALSLRLHLSQRVPVPVRQSCASTWSSELAVAIAGEGWALRRKLM
jgi:hypothetical protein